MHNMDSSILNAISEITRHRDMDVLDNTLIISLAKIIPANTISLYKPFNGGITFNYDEIFRTSVSIIDNRINDQECNEKILFPSSQHLKDCFKSASTVEYKTSEEKNNILIPVFIDKKVAGAVHIEFSSDISPYIDIAKSIINIYSNHLSVLNESERDKLTGLLNRRTFDNTLNKLLDRQKCKQKTYLSREKPEKRKFVPDQCSWLAMLDIDHFKNINDHYGHLFGDEVILILSQQMGKFFRNTDLLFRFGGEEFIVILEPTTPEKAKQTFGRFGQIIADYPFPQLDRVTISIGYARITMNDYPHTILDRADKALYYAKENGRNCVFNYEELIQDGYLREKKPAETTTLFNS